MELEPDGLVILFDLDPGLRYGQVEPYVSAGYATRHLANAERQELFDEEIIPRLDECDFDAALLGTMSRIAAAAEVGPNAEEAATGD